MKMKPKLTRTKMSEEELEHYYKWTKKSAHVFRNRKKYDRKSSKLTERIK